MTINKDILKKIENFEVDSNETKKNISISLDVELLEYLNKLSKKTKLSRSRLVNKILNEYFYTLE